MARKPYKYPDTFRPGVTLSKSVWVAAQQKAKREGHSTSEVINALLLAWTGIDEEDFPPVSGGTHNGEALPVGAGGAERG